MYYLDHYFGRMYPHFLFVSRDQLRISQIFPKPAIQLHVRYIWKILLKILGIHAYISRFNREEPETEKWFQTLFFVTSLAIPLLCILCFYLNMLVRLWKGSAATHGPGPMRDKNNACKGKENKVRVTRMVIIVIIVFAICWVPLQVILLIFGSTPLDT